MKPETAKQKQLRITARSLFWKHGIKRVTIEEICQQASVSKATFYKFFKNKNALILHMLNYLFEEALSEYTTISTSNSPYPAKVEAIISMKIKIAKEMSAELFSELYVYPDPEIQKFLVEASNNTMQLVLNDLKSAQLKGEIRKELKPEFIMWYLNKLVDLVKDETLFQFFDNTDDIIKAVLTMFYQGIVSPEKK